MSIIGSQLMMDVAAECTYAANGLPETATASRLMCRE
jgi:hypothetical protein